MIFKISNLGLKDSDPINIKMYMENSRIKQVNLVLSFDEDNWMSIVSMGHIVGTNYYRLIIPSIPAR